MTGFPEARPLKKANAKSVKQFFHDNIISRYGLPGIVVIDGGSEFKKELKEFCEAIRVARIIVLAYNP